MIRFNEPGPDGLINIASPEQDLHPRSSRLACYERPSFPKTPRPLQLPPMWIQTRQLGKCGDYAPELALKSYSRVFQGYRRSLLLCVEQTCGSTVGGRVRCPTQLGLQIICYRIGITPKVQSSGYENQKHLGRTGITGDKSDILTK